MKTLRDCGAEETVCKTYNSMAVNTELIDCDYFSLTGSSQAKEHSDYTGEFMAQYSWAEYMNGYLDRILMENNR